MPRHAHVPYLCVANISKISKNLRFKNTIVIALRALQLIFKRTTDDPDYPDVETPLQCVAKISKIVIISR